MDNNVPCYGCERRQSGCHSSCESYKEYSEKNAERVKLLRNKRAENAIFTDTRIRAIHKTAGKRHNQRAWKG